MAAKDSYYSHLVGPKYQFDLDYFFKIRYFKYQHESTFSCTGGFLKLYEIFAYKTQKTAS